MLENPKPKNIGKILINLAIVEINFGHQKIDFMWKREISRNLCQTDVWNKDISIRDNKFEEKFLLENIYLYHYLYEHII